VLRFQGPRANGMPELHSLSPSISVLQDRGFKVALVTDGRMSGASGKTPAAIHVSPEAAKGGPLAYVQDGDTAAARSSASCRGPASKTSMSCWPRSRAAKPRP
jgi:phosphogluconate dehydratase